MVTAKRFGSARTDEGVRPPYNRKLKIENQKSKLLPMPILVATGNPHKLEEIRAVIAEHSEAADAIALVSLADLPQSITEPVEDQPTFAGNALKKARHYAQASGLTCLADDSGLEVDALDGRPGVYSARYAGVTGPRSVVDPANNRLLLQNLADVPIARRSARFVCTMALVSPAGDILAQVRGTVEGRILLPEEGANPDEPWRGRGHNGFGYDPLFLLPAPRNLTTAELPPDAKNAISHRGQATRLIYPHLCRAAGGIHA